MSRRGTHRALGQSPGARKGAWHRAGGEPHVHCPILRDPRAAANNVSKRAVPSAVGRGGAGGTGAGATLGERYHTRTRACTEPGESGQAWLLKAGWYVIAGFRSYVSLAC